MLVIFDIGIFGSSLNAVEGTFYITVIISFSFHDRTVWLPLKSDDLVGWD